MAELIDRDKCQDRIFRFADRLTDWGYPEQAKAVRAVAKGIKLEKTVDAVEVVRCRDCKRWCTVDSAPNYGSCSKLEDRYKEDCESFFDETTRFDDFCSYGERKENG